MSDCTWEHGLDSLSQQTVYVTAPGSGLRLVCDSSWPEDNPPPVGSRKHLKECREDQKLCSLSHMWTPTFGNVYALVQDGLNTHICSHLTFINGCLGWTCGPHTFQLGLSCRCGSSQTCRSVGRFVPESLEGNSDEKVQLIKRKPWIFNFHHWIKIWGTDFLLFKVKSYGNVNEYIRFVLIKRKSWFKSLDHVKEPKTG